MRQVLLINLLGLNIALSSAFAGGISRKADFLLNVSQETRNNEHGGWGVSGAPCWSYFLVKDYFQYFDNGSKNLDFGKMLADAKIQPLKSSGSLNFQSLERNDKYQILSDCRINAESAYVFWNSYPNTPKGSTSPAAIIMKYRIPKDGIYSLRGNLDCLAEKPAKDAIFAIGVQDKSAFRPFFTHTFGQEVPAGEANLLKVLDNEQALQDMKLSAGDQIVFLIGSARQSNLPLSVIDDNVRIVSEV
ncbi:MAG: hypothetical protein WCP55_24295, partial [Lentisphaerota bacterium]